MTDLPVLTLRGDLTGTAFGAAATWTDYTAYLETGANGQPVDITWGRQDNRAEVQVGQMSFLLNNTSGIFTSGASPIEVDHLFNVRLTANAVTTDRFTGYVTSVEPTWPGGVQSWSVVRVNCMDVTGKLSESQPLRSMLEHEMLGDGPLFLYPLSEASGATSVGDISPNAQPALQLRTSKYGAGEVTFGGDMLMTDGSVGVGFDSTTAGTATNGGMSALSVTTSAGSSLMPPSGTGFSLACWVKIDAAPSTESVIAGWFSSDGVVHASLRVDSLDRAYFLLDDRTAVYMRSDFVSGICDGQPHYLVGTVNGSGLEVGLIVDGVASTTSSYPSAANLTGLTTLVVGGNLAGASSNRGLRGQVYGLAAYGTPLDAVYAIEHYQAGMGTLYESSNIRYDRIASYAGVATTGLPTGVAVMGHQQLAGQNVLEALAEVARTEGTVSYATGAGALTFQARTSRYNATAALTLTGDDIDPGIPIRKDRQDFFNELTVERPGGATQRAVNTASQAGKAGRVDGGSFTVAPSTDADALNNATWQVAQHATQRARFPALKVDLLSRDANPFQANVLTLGMGSLLQVTTLPSQAPIASPQVFIEGGHEVISVDDWNVEFFTSPQTIENHVFRVGTSGSDPLAALDGTNYVGL